MQGMILVTWGGGVIVGSPQGDLPLSTVHTYVTKEISLVVWGGGVVVGSPQGSLPIATVHAHATEKICY